MCYEHTSYAEAYCHIDLKHCKLYNGGCKSIPFNQDNMDYLKSILVLSDTVFGFSFLAIRDHVTFDPTILYTHCSPLSIHYITLVDGSHDPVVWFGILTCNLHLHCKSCFIFQTLFHSFIFIHKLTHDQDCEVVFFSFPCVFYDLTTRTVFGVAKET